MSLVTRLVESRTNYWFSFVADSTLALIFFVFGVSRFEGGWAGCLLAVLLGGLSWGLIEYSFHRWFFHLRGSPAYASHLRHHEEPDELIALPWFFTTFLGILIWLGVRLLLPASPAAFFMATLTAGYVFYGLLHHVFHHWDINVMPGKLMRRAWSYHKIHHALPATNFGVTTSLWDRIFGTHYRSAAQRKHLAVP